MFHSDEIIPYILFSYQHVTNLNKEGFFFISFSATKIFSFEKNNIKNKNENNENEEIKNKLLYDMNISCIFIIEEKSEMNLNVKEITDNNNNKGNIYKEINIKKKDFILYKEKIIEIKNWLRQEVIQGHSCFFNIINFEYDEINNNKINNIDWIYIIIIIICLVTEVEYESLINYFREKIIYIDKINELLNQIDKKEISDTLNFLNN